MNKFLFKSSDADFQKFLQLQLDNMNKNILYITHRVDTIIKTLDSLHNDIFLKKQAEEYLDNNDD